MQKTFLITGGAGFIGTNLAHALVAQGYRVRVVDDVTAGDKTRLPSEVEFFELDVRNTSALAPVFSGVDTVIHLAALPRVQFSIDEPVTSHDVNVGGTLSVLEAARQAKVGRVVFATSSAIYGDQENMPLAPTMSAMPKSPYALHKYIGEEYLKLWSELFKIQTVSLRFFNVYGPHLDPEGPYALVIGRFLKQRKVGEPLSITGDGKQTRDFVHVSDVVSALICAAGSDKVGSGEVLNVGSGVETSINELASLIGGDTVYVPARIEPRRSVADISITKELLLWSPKVSLAEGMAALKKEFQL